MDGHSHEHDPAHTPDADATQSLEPNPGLVLKNRYLLTREIGRGGFGSVFLARDMQLHDRLVVVKIKLDQSIADPWFERKFSEEVRALALIDHPGVVGVLDSGRTPNGQPFLVMQHIEGATLRSILTPEGLPLDRVASIVRQIGQALAAAHAKKIWHRDLKPENIMLQLLPGGDEHVKLIDFGIATIADLTPEQTSTRVAGSLAYMAPEQVSGQPTAATDIYAFGVIAYEILTGRKPFTPEHAIQLCMLQREGVRVKPSALRPAISAAAEKLILQALCYNPNDRPVSASELGDQLSRALLAPPPPVRTPGQNRRSGALWAAGLVLVLIIAAAGLWMNRSRISSAQPQTVVVSPPAKNADQPQGSNQDVELVYWNSIKDEHLAAPFQAYLSKYPSGLFADLAKWKIGMLAAPPKPKPQTTAAIAKAPVPVWTSMFDGKTLKGWKANENPESWTVRDGAITGDGAMSYLFWMDRECGNCEFKAMAKINDGGNSGMFFRAAFGRAFRHGYEAQVNSTHRDPVKTGSLYGFADLYQSPVPPEIWFSQRIVVEGTHIQIFVNDSKMVDFVDANNTYGSGYLALQQQEKGTVVQFKELSMRVLDSK